MRVMYGDNPMFKKDGLCAEDLDGPVVVEIKSVGTKEMTDQDGNPTTKGEVRFKGESERAKKPYRFGPLVAGQIARATGVIQAKDWPGHKITIYPTTCRAFGQTTTCIRVRKAAPAEGGT